MGLHYQFWYIYHTFFGSYCYEMEKFLAYLCCGSSEHSVHIADDNNRVTSPVL